MEAVKHPYLNGKQVTLSIGVDILNKDEHFEVALKRADTKLYFAKKTGKNKIYTEL